MGILTEMSYFAVFFAITHRKGKRKGSGSEESAAEPAFNEKE